jgi:hypothetical protein
MLPEAEGKRELEKFIRKFAPHVSCDSPSTLFHSLQMAIAPHSSSTLTEVMAADSFQPQEQQQPQLQMSEQVYENQQFLQQQQSLDVNLQQPQQLHYQLPEQHYQHLQETQQMYLPPF